MNLDWLGPVREISASCIVADDPGSVVRKARPLTPEDAAAMREQAIAKMQRDPAAILDRERRIAIKERQALRFERRTA